MIQALGGHVHGSAVAFLMANSYEHIQYIECTASTAIIPMIGRSLSVLGLDVLKLQVQGVCPEGAVIPPNIFEQKGSCFGVYVPGDNVILTVLIVPYTIEIVRELMCGCFDFKRLSSSFDMLYTRANKPGGIDTYNGKLTDTVFSTLSRIHQRRFCLAMLPTHPEGPIREAECLIECGWVMDDLIHHDMCWVVGRWAFLQPHSETTVRKSQQDSQRDMSSVSECAICLSSFRNDDMVINLSCNHNFHPTPCLTTWINHIQSKCIHDTVNCPCCRSSITFMKCE